MIISASDMRNSGRMLHDLEWRQPDPRNGLLLVGYQAERKQGRCS